MTDTLTPPATDVAGLARKISEAVSEIGSVEKRGTNDFHRYSYVTAEDILREIRKPLADRQVALFPSLVSIQEREYTTSQGKQSVLTTVNVEFSFVDGESGAIWSCRWAGEGDDPADKGLGKAYTNAIKTFLRAQFLIPQGDDPEADGGTDERAANRQSGGATRQGRGEPRGEASDKQISFIATLAAKNRSLADAWAKHLGVELGGPITKSQASQLIEALKDKKPAPTGQSDVPADADGFEHAPVDDGEDIPF